MSRHRQHNDIWRAIDMLAARHGLSASALARQAGLDATTFNPSKRHSKDGRPRWPSTESVAAALNAVHATLGDLADIVDGDGENLRSATPVMSLDQARTECFDSSGRPTGPEWSRRRLEGIDYGFVWALVVSGRDLMPAVQPGDRLIVSAETAPQPGDRVVIGLETGEVALRELVGQAGEQVQVRELNSELAPQYLDRVQIAWMTRILWIGRS